MPITLSLLLQLKDIKPQTIHDLAVQGIEIERLNLQSFEANLNPTGYAASMKKITQYFHILSVLRGDTLDALSDR